MKIIENRKTFLFIGALLVVLSIFLIAFFGLKQGIDLKGGTSWQIRIASSEQEIRAVLSEAADFKEITVRTLAKDVFLIKLPFISEQEHHKYLTALENKLGPLEEMRFEKIGPIIGREIKGKFTRAAVLGILAIIFYLTFSFRKVSGQIKSFKYGLVSVFCLLHDILIPTGLMSFLGWKYMAEIDTKFIVALLFILGYSVNNTIVLFDRIRENLSFFKSSQTLKEIINLSVKESVARSINTSLTTIFVLATLYFLGPFVLRYFFLTLFTGIVVGTFSSLFLAPCLLFLWQKRGLA